MNTVQKVAVIIAMTGMLTAAVLPGRQTANVISAGGTAVSKWQRTAITGK
jgi:hypothetical protein